jgi:hypothetical protein
MNARTRTTRKKIGKEHRWTSAQTKALDFPVARRTHEAWTNSQMGTNAPYEITPSAKTQPQ